MDWFTTPNNFSSGFDHFDDIDQQFSDTALPLGFGASAPHGQALNGQFIPDQNYSFPSLDPSFESFIQVPQDVTPIGNMNDLATAQIPAATSMDPPPKTRKKKARTLRDEDWEPYKDRILELYDTHKLPLEKVKVMIEEEFGFVAQPRQYQARITKWGKDKNIKKVEMAAIVRKQQQRKILEVGKREQIFTVRGREVKVDKIDRWMDRNNVPRDDLYAPSPPHYRFKQADEDRLRTELSVSETLFGFEHTQTLDILAKLATVLFEQGRFKSAENMIRKALEGYQKIVGGDGIHNLDALDLLASIKFEQGLYRQGEKLLESTYESKKAALGEEHPSTLACMHRLVAAYTYQGWWGKAEVLSERLSETSTRGLGEENRLTLLIKSILGHIYRQLGKYEAAEKLITQSLKLSKKVLGDDDPDTLFIMAILARLYTDKLRLDEAEMLEMQVANIRTRMLGGEHPITLASMRNLALIYQHQGRLKEAEALGEQVLEIGKKIFGEKHPETLRIARVLISVYEEQQEYGKSEELRRYISKMEEN
ncbi:hypothetical protein IL306_012241 [Fusarium sp. DS 682]|nr:hypothetical protein IL306_012241 [Fusarium sp. DS 682]